MTKQIVPEKIKALYTQRCRMRDGVELATDVYMPAQGGPFPTIVQRTPYDRGNPIALTAPDAVFLAQRGYALVVQDVRGRYDSEGEWYPFANEADDGHDTIEWAAKQPWSNGKVGTIGASYFGLTQWQAAQGGSSHLVASVPRVAYSNLYHNWVYTGGAFQLAFNLSWSIVMSTRTNRPQFMWLPDEVHLKSLLWHLPVVTGGEAAGHHIKHYTDWVSHPSYDDYWRGMGPVEDSYDKISVAAYGMAGWFDVFLQGNLNSFMGMTKKARTPEARRKQKIIVGPWIHLLGGSLAGGLGTHSKTGDIDFGPNVILDLQAEQVRWLNYIMKGEDDGIGGEPRVRVFVMGSNRWRESDDWPIPGTEYTPFYLHSDGGANALTGNGTLDTMAPQAEQHDHYTYDPMHPVPTLGGSTCCMEDALPVSMGPRDQRPIEYRQDVLCYTSAPLEAPIEVTGPVKAVLYASSSARDTDWVVKLVDVFPDGYAMNVAQGILRARYRDSWEEPTLLEPGRVYKFEVDLWSTGNCFLPGHRIRVDVTSSCFPQFDRNPNTGHAFGQDAEMVAADQTVLHDSANPSQIVLPVIPQE